jgi:hypothetical protein
MESEAKIIIAFLFNRSGKTLLKDSELYLPLSMELGWLSTKESQEFVKYAVTQGLLVKKEELLQPNFPLEKIVIPLGFTPSKRLFSEKTEEQPGNLIDAIIASLSTHLNKSHEELRREIKQEGKEKNLLPEVAALSVGKKHGVDVTAWYEAVERLLFKQNKG